MFWMSIRPEDYILTKHYMFWMSIRPKDYIFDKKDSIVAVFEIIIILEGRFMQRVRP